MTKTVRYFCQREVGPFIECVANLATSAENKEAQPDNPETLEGVQQVLDSVINRARGYCERVERS